MEERELANFLTDVAKAGYGKSRSQIKVAKRVAVDKAMLTGKKDRPILLPDYHLQDCHTVLLRDNCLQDCRLLLQQQHLREEATSLDRPSTLTNVACATEHLRRTDVNALDQSG